MATTFETHFIICFPSWILFNSIQRAISNSVVILLLSIYTLFI